MGGDDGQQRPADRQGDLPQGPTQAGVPGQLLSGGVSVRQLSDGRERGIPDAGRHCGGPAAEGELRRKRSARRHPGSSTANPTPDQDRLASTASKRRHVLPLAVAGPPRPGRIQPDENVEPTAIQTATVDGVTFKYFVDSWGNPVAAGSFPYSNDELNAPPYAERIRPEPAIARSAGPRPGVRRLRRNVDDGFYEDGPPDDAAAAVDRRDRLAGAGTI